MRTDGGGWMVRRLFWRNLLTANQAFIVWSLHHMCVNGWLCFNIKAGIRVGV